MSDPEPYSEAEAAPAVAAGEPAPTGHPQVDAALEGLDRAAALPPGEQIAAYDTALSTLQEALTTIDENP